MRVWKGELRKLKPFFESCLTLDGLGRGEINGISSSPRAQKKRRGRSPKPVSFFHRSFEFQSYKLVGGEERSGVKGKASPLPEIKSPASRVFGH